MSIIAIVSMPACCLNHCVRLAGPAGTVTIAVYVQAVLLAILSKTTIHHEASSTIATLVASSRTIAEIRPFNVISNQDSSRPRS
jgi:hypothetical protein